MKFLLTIVALSLLAAPARAAGDVAVLDGCTDHRGHTIPVVADYAQPQLVQVVDSGQRSAIRYNPTVLPRLGPACRLFFHAGACALVAAGKAGKTLSAAEARAVDCIALKTLLDAGALQPDQVAGLQGELVFSAAEWELLPGPVRSISFAGCHSSGNVLRLPVATPPSARQLEWNACVRVCGDRLWGCQQRCRTAPCEEACLELQRACEAGCGVRSE